MVAVDMYVFHVFRSFPAVIKTNVQHGLEPSVLFIDRLVANNTTLGNIRFDLTPRQTAFHTELKLSLIFSHGGQTAYQILTPKLKCIFINAKLPLLLSH